MKTKPIICRWTLCAGLLFMLLLPCRAQVTDWFTEGFDGTVTTNDMQFRTLTYTPNGNANYYYACQQPAAAFPTDPTGGTVVTLGDDDFVQVTLSGSQTVAIYGTRTNVFFIGSNGYLTMNSGDTAYIAYPSGTSFNWPSNHFNLPRVSGWFYDLNPSAGGTVSWKQTGDRVAVTFSNVLDSYTATYPSSFQIEMFFDGRIQITYLQVMATSGLAGLSAGQGVPAGFAQSDLDLYANCSMPAIITQPVGVTVPVGSTATFSVEAISSVPMSYFWRRNAVLIPGATNSIYSTNNVQLVDSGALFSCLVSNAFGSVLSSNALLTVTNKPVSGTVFLVGSYLYLPICSNGVFIASYTGGKYNAAGTGGASGIDFWWPGTPVYNFDAGVGGTSYVDGFTGSSYNVNFNSVSVYNLSTSTLQHAQVAGKVTATLSFTRDVSFAPSSKVITILDTLQNIGGSTLNNVVTMDNTDPDIDANKYGVYATLNDVVTVNTANDMVVATGPTSGTSLGFGSDSGIQIPSAGGFSNPNAYSYPSVVDPNGASGDIGINLTENYGTLTAGQSKSVVWYMIFDDTKAKVISDFAGAAAANLPTITQQPVGVSVPVGGTAAFTIAATSATPLSYFWRSNTVPIPGANLTNYTVSNVQMAGSGALFSCIVSNYYGTVTSSNAMLSVQQPPFFSAMLITNGYFQATLNGTPASNYMVYVSSNLVSWPSLKTVVVGADGTTNVTDTNVSLRVRFYRAKLYP